MFSLLQSAFAPACKVVKIDSGCTRMKNTWSNRSFSSFAGCIPLRRGPRRAHPRVRSKSPPGVLALPPALC